MIQQRFQCQSCKGEYFDVQADGTPYYHACPPLPPDKDGVVLERPDKRDENIAPLPSGRPFALRGIVAEGKGTTCLTNPDLIEPAHLTTILAPAKEENA